MTSPADDSGVRITRASGIELLRAIGELTRERDEALDRLAAVEQRTPRWVDTIVVSLALVGLVTVVVLVLRVLAIVADRVGAVL